MPARPPPGLLPAAHSRRSPASGRRCAWTATTTPPTPSGTPPPGNCGGAPSRTSNATSSSSPATAASPGPVKDLPPVRLPHGKAAEYQARGAVHFHALLRLDGTSSNDPAAIITPPPGITAADLQDAIGLAAATVCFRTRPHPDSPDGEGWLIAWGRELDVRTVAARGPDTVTGPAVAAYLAKYSTKGTEASGHHSARITPDSLDLYADPAGTHTQRLIDACWYIGHAGGRMCGKVTYASLRRWAHMLGFGGHFLTKARRYSVTLTALRQARITYRRHQDTGPDYQPFLPQNAADPQTAIILATLSYAGTGWHATGDALLANTAADQARKRREAGHEEITSHYGKVRQQSRLEKPSGDA